MGFRVGRLVNRQVSWSLSGLTVLALAAGLTLLSLNADQLNPAQLGFEMIVAAAVLLYAGTGRLISARVPGNAIGWLLALIGLVLAGEMLTEHYAVYGLVTAPGSLPAVRITGWSSIIFAVLGAFALLYLILLFPDGRLPSPRWRPVQVGIGVVLVAAVASQMQAGQLISGGLTDVLDNAHASYLNPVGIFPRHGWFGGFIALVIVLAVAIGLTSVASVFARRRGATAERRKQLAWLGYVGLITLFWIAVLLLGMATGGGGPAWIGNALWILCVLTPIAGIPVACVVAVLRYRLYDIDRIISRTLAYAIFTGLLVGMYAGLVLLATGVLRVHTPVAVAAATLAAAALFNPLRRRVQVAVDRRFNRARYDADQTVTAFAARLKDATDLDAVRGDLTATVDRALEPAHVSVWINRG